MGNQEDALSTFSEIRKLDPSDNKGAGNLAYSLAAAGKFDESENLYNNLIE